MEAYFLLLTVFGAVVILTAWLPMLLTRLPLSLPMVCIGIGFVLVWTPFSPVTWVNPLENRYLTERLTEFVVIIALMGAGLKLDRPVSWRGWETSWRLVGIAMPLTIAGITLLGWTVLGLGVASALLLGAALSPTDPVLASDIQVGPPHSDNEDEVRFALTSEAGLNDGAAFPFVHLAVALAISHTSGEPFLTDWFLVDVVWKIASGVSIGWLGGRVMAYITFRLLSAPNDGLVALGITCLAYGSTELLHGYGFLSVFITAVAFRSFERKHQYHTRLHEFSEQIERLVMMILLVCFGAAIAEGSIFAGLDLGSRVDGTPDPLRCAAYFRMAVPGEPSGAAVGKGCDRILRYPGTWVVLLSRLRAGPSGVRAGPDPLGHSLLRRDKLDLHAWRLGNTDNETGRSPDTAAYFSQE